MGQNSKGIGEVTTYKPVRLCNMEELAERQKTIKPSGGILFARATNREEKHKARKLILDLLSKEKWPSNLRMLTMPGVDWKFERLLLGEREEGWSNRAGPKKTHFTAVENDRSIFFASVTAMPGLHTPKALLKQTNMHVAERGVKTNYAAFYFANVDDILAAEWPSKWNVAWLDYTGPLTVERLKLIKDFYELYVDGIIIVTALKARWNKATVSAINKAGGHSEWLQQHLVGEILHDIEYSDSSPMAQFAIRKNNQ